MILSTSNKFARTMKVTEQAKTDLPAPPAKQGLYDSDNDEDSEDDVSAKNMTTVLPPDLFEYIAVDDALSGSGLHAGRLSTDGVGYCHYIVYFKFFSCISLVC